MADESVTIYAYDSDLNWLGQREGDGTKLQPGESLLPYIVVYGINADSKELGPTKVVRNDYTVGDDETTVAPTPGLYTPITWDGKAWQGTDEATYQARVDAEAAQYLADHPVTPSATDTAIAQLAYQRMQDQATISDLQAQNAQIAYQLMTVQGGTK
ncbi:hypothetical protein FC50_GL001816 [Lacticaseibacillus pantheris DSM 15945 = JCM 12539 = NBRC 106106]|uniref:Uncharacterized protein n=1 Tax=Lacticaseibacillus pantheris DSM 15945 = JCM 12539 = NBRC 106106 TaxID=1423783 RepID=A0A0R1TX39_9LACO|nr:hypothetical protein [Lacticaseibacillus pantheris]KRL85342.1 hypothetical protein FC50_GL001816 [Lacticaseibacillus pantheris DSM 15945 = JCM 12539 = NBRC 106106]